MQDVAAVLLFATALSIVGVLITSSILDEHVDAAWPSPLKRWRVSSHGNTSLTAELFWTALFIGGGEVVLTLVLVHPESSIPARIVALVQLVGAVSWTAYLLTVIRRSSK